MKTNLKEKFKKLRSMRFTKLIIGIVVVAIVAVIGLTNNTVQTKLFGKKTPIVQNVSTVKKGNLQTIVSGSGPIYFTSISKLSSQVNATVTAVNYKAGDSVKKGAVIYTFDATDAQATIASSQNALTQSQISAGSSTDDVASLTVTAPISGKVTNIAVSTGDTVQKGGPVITISDTSTLQVSVPFSSSDIRKIAVGAVANVSTSAGNVTGTVTSISPSQGSKSPSVEIQMSNPGTLSSGMTANAYFTTSKGTLSGTSTAPLEYITNQSVSSATGGTVQSISVGLNQNVSSGNTLMTMQSNDITRAQEISNLQIADSQAKLNTALTQLANYKIIAPFDGVITVINNKVGDSVKPGDEVADVVDPTKMEFDVPVDELDVAKLTVGQTSTISIDALPDTTATPLKGKVASIAVIGAADSGVTTYPVTVAIDGNLSALKSGMNANANIVVSNTLNILYVPIEAVTRVGTKNYVWVKSTGNGNSEGSYGSLKPGGTSGNKTSTNSSTTIKGQSYYAGATKTEVQLGANNDTDIQITSGLNEGDVVVLPQTKAASTTAAKTTGFGSMTGGGGAGRTGGGY